MVVGGGYFSHDSSQRVLNYQLALWLSPGQGNIFNWREDSKVSLMLHPKRLWEFGGTNVTVPSMGFENDQMFLSFGWKIEVANGNKSCKQGGVLLVFLYTVQVAYGRFILGNFRSDYLFSIWKGDTLRRIWNFYCVLQPPACTNVLSWIHSITTLGCAFSYLQTLLQWDVR